MKKSALAFLIWVFVAATLVVAQPDGRGQAPQLPFDFAQGKLQVYAQSDTTPPLTTVTLSGTQGLNDWYTSGVEVHLVADDLESGGASIGWKLNNDDWQEEEFLGTLNRVQNPSFEGGGLFYIDNWNDSGAPFWEALFLRSWDHKFGSRSARITIFGSGNYYWHNRNYYSPTEASKTYTASAWVKTEALSGDGAYLAVFRRDIGGSDALITETSKILGTQDWARVSLNFTMPVGYDGVFLRLSASGGWGSVWFDGVSLYEEEETGVSFAIGTSGEHVLEYYAVDNAGNEEIPHQILDFKIDTSAPSGWRNFEVTQTGNNHTFICGIDVSDFVSGLDSSTVVYQYTYNGGQSWSEWLTDAAVASGRITTPAIDFHDSNWSAGKAIRFRISDMAGLEGVSPDQNLFGAWLKTTGGDVYSGGNIVMGSLGPDPGTEGVIVLGGTQVENFGGLESWMVKSYPQVSRRSFGEWLEDFPTTTPLPYGRLPLESGRYFAGDNDFVVDNQTMASGENLAAVVFVGGNLIINADLEVPGTSILLFIVGGDVRISQDVTRIDASFLFDHSFDTGYDGVPPHEQLVVNGLAAGGNFILRRSLSKDGNLTQPAEVFEYPAKILKLGPYLGEGAVSWKETR